MRNLSLFFYLCLYLIACNNGGSSDTTTDSTSTTASVDSLNKKPPSHDTTTGYWGNHNTNTDSTSKPDDEPPPPPPPPPAPMQVTGVALKNDTERTVSFRLNNQRYSLAPGEARDLRINGEEAALIFTGQNRRFALDRYERYVIIRNAQGTLDVVIPD